MRSANCSLEFLRRISRRRRSAPNGVESISEYVEHRAALLTPEHLEELRADLPLLNARFAAIAVQQFPHLQQQLKLLADFFEDTADGVFQAGSDASRKETAFALRYTAKEKDINKDNHTWFIAFAPYESPKIAMAVLVQGAKAGGQVPAPIAAKIIEEILALDRGYDPSVQALTPAVGNFDFVESIDIRDTLVRAQPAATDEEAPEIVPGPVEASKKVTNAKVKPDIRPAADDHRAPLEAQPIQREKRRSFFDFFRRKPKGRPPPQRSEEQQKKKRFLIF
jgi:Penicillin binding protein transpeptidase domain